MGHVVIRAMSDLRDRGAIDGSGVRLDVDDGGSHHRVDVTYERLDWVKWSDQIGERSDREVIEAITYAAAQQVGDLIGAGEQVPATLTAPMLIALSALHAGQVPALEQPGAVVLEFDA